MACISKELRHRKVCPTCKETDPTYFRDKRIKQSLTGFQVHCIHYTKQGEGEGRGGDGGGCDWVGQLGDLERHLNKNPPEDTKMNGCLIIEITCKFCGNRFQRSFIEDHQTNHCPERPYSCPHCQYCSTYIEITEVHIQICPCFPTECPHCSEVLERQHLQFHINNDCLLVPTACDFLLVGCQEQLPRKQMKKHIRKNGVHHAQLLADYAKEHSEDSLKQYLPMLTICVETLTAHTKVISTLRTQNEAYKEKMSTQNKAQLKKISTLTEQNETQQDEISTLRTENRSHMKKIPLLTEQNKAQKKEILTLKTQDRAHREEISTLKRMNEVDMERISTFRKQNKAHMQNICTLRNENENHVATLSSQYRDHMEEKATLETQIRDHTKKISTLETRNQFLETRNRCFLKLIGLAVVFFLFTIAVLFKWPSITCFMCMSVC